MTQQLQTRSLSKFREHKIIVNGHPFELFEILNYETKLFPHTRLQVETSQKTLQVRVEATANEIRAFARSYASAVEAHCLSLLRRLEELRVQRRYDVPDTKYWNQ